MRVLAIAALCTTSFAQTFLPLREAVDRALASHPLLAAGAERVATLAGVKRQAELRINPKFLFQTENLRAWQSPAFDYAKQSDTFAYFQHTLETAHKRERRTDLAEAQLRRGELDRELLRRQIAARVKAAYWSAAAAARLARLFAESVANFGGVVEYHRIRAQEGAIPEADLLRVEVERERFAVQASTAALEAERARVVLFREMGQTEFPEVTFEELPPPGGEPAVDVVAALDRRIEMQAARQEEVAARATYRLQVAQARPNVELLGGYKRSNQFDTLLWGAQVDLPLLNRNQGLIAAADAGVRLAARQIAVQEALVRAEIRTAEAEVRERAKQLAGSLAPLRERAAEVARIAEAAYREGGADLLRLLDAQRARLEADSLYLRTLADYRQAVVALEFALGVFP